MKLTEQRFVELLDAWGGDLRRWPAESRDAAEALLAQSPDARARLADAQAFDALLALPAPAAPSPSLRRAILADAAQRLPARSEPWLRRLWRELGGLSLAGPAFAASLACGIAIAAYADLQPAPSAADVEIEDSDEDADLLAVAQLDDGYQEYAP